MLNITKFRRIKQVQTKFFFSTSIKKFPYKFSKDNLDNQIDIKNDYQKNLLEGFELAYKTFLFGLSQNDYIFLKQTCEENFTENIIDCSENYQKKIYINSKTADDPDIKVFIESIDSSIHYNVSTSRSYNRQNNIKLKERKKDLYYYDGRDHMIVMRFCIDIKSNLLLSEDSHFNFGKNIFEIHNIVVETEFESPLKIMEFTKAGNSFGMGVIKKFLRFTLGRNLKEENIWKISDIDNFMDGNPLV
jgi:hypothetical protein